MRSERLTRSLAGGVSRSVLVRLDAAERCELLALRERGRTGQSPRSKRRLECGLERRSSGRLFAERHLGADRDFGAEGGRNLEYRRRGWDVGVERSSQEAQSLSGFRRSRLGSGGGLGAMRMERQPHVRECEVLGGIRAQPDVVREILRRGSAAVERASTYLLCAETIDLRCRSSRRQINRDLCRSALILHLSDERPKDRQWDARSRSDGPRPPHGVLLRRIERE